MSYHALLYDALVGKSRQFGTGSVGDEFGLLVGKSGQLDTGNVGDEFERLVGTSANAVMFCERVHFTTR